jgi:hypothetical protein
MVYMTNRKTTASYVWLTTVMAYRFFYCMVFLDGYYINMEVY